MGQVLSGAFQALQQARSRPRAERIAEVRKQWPTWSDLQIDRHLQQRDALSRMAEQQARQRAAHCVDSFFEVRS